MTRNIGVPKVHGSCFGTVGYLSIWIRLAVLAALVAWYVLVAILAVAGWLIASPELRPTGWSTPTLIGVNKLSILRSGSLWLFLVMYMDRDLRIARDEGRLLARALRYIVILVALWIPGFLLPIFL